MARGVPRVSGCTSGHGTAPVCLVTHRARVQRGSVLCPPALGIQVCHSTHETELHSDVLIVFSVLGVLLWLGQKKSFCSHGPYHLRGKTEVDKQGISDRSITKWIKQRENDGGAPLNELVGEGLPKVGTSQLRSGWAKGSMTGSFTCQNPACLLKPSPSAMSSKSPCLQSWAPSSVPSSPLTMDFITLDWSVCSFASTLENRSPTSLTLATVRHSALHLVGSQKKIAPVRGWPCECIHILGWLRAVKEMKFWIIFYFPNIISYFYLSDSPHSQLRLLSKMYM